MHVNCKRMSDKQTDGKRLFIRSFAAKYAFCILKMFSLILQILSICKKWPGTNQFPRCFSQCPKNSLATRHQPIKNYQSPLKYAILAFLSELTPPRWSSLRYATYQKLCTPSRNVLKMRYYSVEWPEQLFLVINSGSYI